MYNIEENKQMAEGYIEYGIIYRNFKNNHTHVRKAQMHEFTSKVFSSGYWLPVGKKK